MASHKPFDTFHASQAEKGRDDVGQEVRVQATRVDGELPSAILLEPGNAWLDAKPAAYDFRSDYVTIPTAEMLQSIASSTLGDDIGMEDSTTNAFQGFMAQLTGHEDALFVLSGTMGNQMALCAALTTPPYSVVLDQRSHMARMEVGGPGTLCGAQMREVAASNGHHLTLEDVQTRTTVTATLYDCPTRVVCLENTLGGLVLPLAEAARISAWARAQAPPIHVHLDGARLWEAVAAGAGSLRDYCRLCDSVQLCLTKGLGAPVGSVIVGSRGVVPARALDAQDGWGRHPRRRRADRPGPRRRRARLPRRRAGPRPGPGPSYRRPLARPRRPAPAPHRDQHGLARPRKHPRSVQGALLSPCGRRWRPADAQPVGGAARGALPDQR